ncbi:MAG TPA: tetratricopeptide repeat protein [Polyangia bacterium]|jgi:tetratricopeptide (TPR) repeat protein
MSVTRICALAAALALTGAAVPLAAAPPSPAQREARHHFDEGESLYKGGHYADALAAYQAGYDAQPLPGFLVNIAQCQRRLGDLKAARASYRKFVLMAPDSRLVPEVEELVKQLDDLIADLAKGGTGDTAPAAADVEPHATDPAAPALVVAQPPPPAETPLVATPAPAAPEAPTTTLPRRSHARWWIVGGAALAAVAGGVATAVALSSSSTTTLRAGTLGTLSR